MVAWSVTLWWQGVSAPAHAQRWLGWVYCASTVLVLAVLWGTGVFVRRRIQLLRGGT